MYCHGVCKVTMGERGSGSEQKHLQVVHRRIGRKPDLAGTLRASARQDTGRALISGEKRKGKAMVAQGAEALSQLWRGGEA